MNEYEIAERVKNWIEESKRYGQNVEVQIRNLDTGEVVHTTINPEFVLDVCHFTDVSAY